MACVNVPQLLGDARDGRQRAVARLISLIEHAHPQLPEVAAAVTPHTGRAKLVGVTGPPGAGKSTSTSMLVTALRERGERVGVLAIDPSSPFSGGALLGDRIRMGEHTTDSGVFIRSMATRGYLGGLAWATPQAVRVLDAAGFDVVIIETVGVGQSEVDIVGLADTTVVLLAPGAGDGVQAVKAGILEVADVFVINKADRDGADETVRELQQVIAMARREVRGPSWRQPIVRTVASQGQGASELVDALGQHWQWLVRHDELARRRETRAGSEVEAITLRRLREEITDVHGGSRLAELARDVSAHNLDPYSAAERLIEQLRTPTER